MKLLYHNLIVVLSLIATITTSLAADTYKIDASHTTIGFSVSHLVISEVHGRFNTFEGEIVLDNQKLVSAKATIKAKSIDTGIEKRDEHLRNADFFDVEKFPEITFVSTGVEKNVMVGKFTMHGVTKEIRLPVTIKGPIKDPWGSSRIGFSSEITINRKDYGLTWNKVLETGGLAVGEDIAIKISGEAVKVEEKK